MTPRERVLAVLQGRKPDQVPLTIYETMFPQCAAERVLRNAGACIIERRVPSFTKSTPNCVTETHTYHRDGHERRRTVIRTPVGEISTVDEAAGFTRWTIERLFKGPQDYKVLRYMAEDEQYAPNYEAYTRAEKYCGDDVLMRYGPGGIPLHVIMIHYMGVELFAVEWMERRDEILRLERAMRESQRKAFPIVAASPITHANLGGNLAPEVMGPPRLREFCLPFLNECAEIMHEHGKLLGSHMDANNKAWAADLAASKLDYIEAFTPAPDTDMTLAEALEAWPDKVLWINFPSSLHLASLDVIRRTTRELIETAAGTHRLILGITEDMPEDRWQENLLAISEVINEMKGDGNP